MGVYEMWCTCGHTEDEHDGTFLNKCEVDGCDCEVFDEDPDAVDDDD